jgi:hypothetical protein
MNRGRRQGFVENIKKMGKFWRCAGLKKKKRPEVGKKGGKSTEKVIWKREWANFGDIWR